MEDFSFCKNTIVIVLGGVAGQIPRREGGGKRRQAVEAREILPPPKLFTNLKNLCIPADASNKILEGYYLKLFYGYISSPGIHKFLVY